MAGASLTVSVQGSRTHFDDSSALSFSPGGIEVESIQLRNAYLLEADIAVESSAREGPRYVTVRTGDEVATGLGMFIVQVPSLSLSPSSGIQGDVVDLLTIRGGTGGYSSWTRVNLGPGISIGAVSASGSVIELTNVQIAVDAPVGPHQVTLTQPEVSVADAFRVQQGPDTRLLSITPGFGDRGHPALPVSLEGQNTHFNHGDLTISFSGTVILVTDRTAADGSHMDVVLAIPDTAPERICDVTVALGLLAGCTTCESVTLPDSFEITKPGQLTSAEPQVIEAGQSTSVSITASDGQFAAASTFLVIDPPDGVEVTSLNVADSDHLTVDLDVSPDAPGDPRDLKAVTGTEVALGPGLIDIHRPEIRGISPSSAFQGMQGLRLTIKGVDIPFSDGSLVEFSGTGIVVESVQFDPSEPEELQAVITISPDAPATSRDVTVTAQDVEVTGTGIFQVIVPNLKQPDEGCACGNPPPAGVPILFCLSLLALCLLRTRKVR
jgi:hypothetical protein